MHDRLMGASYLRMLKYMRERAGELVQARHYGWRVQLAGVYAQHTLTHVESLFFLLKKTVRDFQSSYACVEHLIYS